MNSSENLLKRLEPQVDVSDLDSPLCSKVLSPFHSNQWLVKLDSSQGVVDFNVVIDEQTLLTDEPDLLKTVKWLLLLSIVDSGATRKPLTSLESLNRYLEKISYFIRFLRVNYGINNPKNATNEMVREFANSLSNTVAHNLKYKERFNKFSIFVGGDFSSYTHLSKRSKGRFEKVFKLENLLFDIGIPLKSWAAFKELANITDNLKNQYLSSKNRVEQKNSGKNTSVNDKNSHGSIDKQISALNRTLRIAKRFPILVPMMPPNIKIISDSEILKIKKLGNQSSQTKDVPFFVMLKTIEASIQYIIHYGQILLAHRNNALRQFNEFKLKKPSYDPAELAKEYFRKHPITIDGYKNSFPPIIITNFDKSYNKKSTQKDMERWAEVYKLYSGGESMPTLAEKFNTSKGTISVWIKKYKDPYISQKQNYGLTTFLYHHMMVAIELVLCFFTGRRSAEIMSLKAGCISTTQSGHWIQMYVAKTYRVNDKFPATNLVKICIDLLEEISRPARKITGNDNLWQYKSMLSDNVSKYLFKSHKALYFEFIGIEGEFQWQFSEHQFRRFFACTFVNHFGGSIDTLKYHLRHTDIAMTLEYLNSKSENNFTDLPMQTALFELLPENYRQSGGFKMSSDIAEQFNQCLDGIKSVTDFDVRKRYEKYVKENGIVFEMVESGLCVGNTKSRQAKSQCIKNDERPHTLTANTEQCKGCPNLLALENWHYKNLDNHCLLEPEDSIIFQSAISTDLE